MTPERRLKCSKISLAISLLAIFPVPKGSIGMVDKIKTFFQSE